MTFGKTNLPMYFGIGTNYMRYANKDTGEVVTNATSIQLTLESGEATTIMVFSTIYGIRRAELLAQFNSGYIKLKEEVSTPRDTPGVMYK